MRAELNDLPLPNWFWHGESLLPIIERYRPVECVELGTNRGCSAIATARLIQQWGGRLTCVDKWAPSGTEVSLDEFLENVAAVGVTKSIRTCQALTTLAASIWDGGPIDYLYIGADHTFEAMTADLEAWWPHVKIGGLVAGDDYDDPNDPVARNVTRAWDAFEERHGQAFERTPTPGLPPIVEGARLIWGVKR